MAENQVRPECHCGFEGLFAAARREITPSLDVRARCWGMARHDLPTGVHRPLTLTALVLQSLGGLPLLLISADLSWFRRADDEWRVRGPILQELGLPPENVLFHIIHTHAGPSLNADEADRPGGDKVGPYLDLLAKRSIDAATEAISRLAPGKLEWATGHCSNASRCERNRAPALPKGGGKARRGPFQGCPRGQCRPR